MIPISCVACVFNDGSPMPCNCEWNAYFHKHECIACGRTIWLEGGPSDDKPTHARSILRGACHLLPKVTP